MTKTELWDRLGRTDPKHTKPFKRAGGFGGTAIKPIYSILRMTEEFGACGVGWGMNQPTFQVVEGNGETLVYCTVSIWHGNRENVVFGVGGDKAVSKNKNGAFVDDEAFKKAFTDAIGNAMKFIGMSADVHMGMFDDSKYVASLRENPYVARPADIVDSPDYDDNGEIIDNIPHAEASKKLRVVDQRPLFDAIQKEAQAFATSKAFLTWMGSETTIARVADFKPDWQQIFRGVCKEHLAALREQERGDDTRMAG